MLRLLFFVIRAVWIAARIMKEHRSRATNKKGRLFAGAARSIWRIDADK